MNALFMKQTDIIEYFIINGLDLKQPKLKDCLYEFVSICKYTNDDPPFDILFMLIKYNADFNYVNPKNYKSPLHQAIKYGIFEFVKILIHNGADVNCVDKKKRVPANMI